eukprot:CAMPEP_0206009076 /NCGR_PEP_ID=MMETSP1464-20131121/8990_1 /ASSEMBLY_ACC=CAM_ASM_001124 /TAXON_ID=119497 /ORGANISM="Exanthemachrysis gayraliae, Strain RCC1523" /LENGTH=339 /DNA_ID=CAMNT_0053382661 /DNA_START=21 /DNA_END=1037 /DNA_ORIENTATION=+
MSRLADGDSDEGHLVKRAWTREEDVRLKEVVGEVGAHQWSSVAEHLEGRTGKQCRERWFNHLCPEVKKGAWTPEEDALIVKCVDEMGKAWSVMASRFPGRTDHAIKNRYNSNLRRETRRALKAQSMQLAQQQGAGAAAPAAARAAESPSISRPTSVQALKRPPSLTIPETGESPPPQRAPAGTWRAGPAAGSPQLHGAQTRIVCDSPGTQKPSAGPVAAGRGISPQALRAGGVAIGHPSPPVNSPTILVQGTPLRGVSLGYPAPQQPPGLHGHHGKRTYPYGGSDSPMNAGRFRGGQRGAFGAAPASYHPADAHARQGLPGPPAGERRLDQDQKFQEIS